MRLAVKDVVERLAPSMVAERSLRASRRLRREWGLTGLAERYAGTHGTTVARGPFAGLQYPPAGLADVDAAVAKLVGSYEAELYPVFARWLEHGSGLFVDVGSADGYFAVGVAVADASATVHAYDL